MGRMGFGQKWRSWMHTYISSTSFTVLINRGPLTFFKASRGFRQRSPLSLLLFIIVMKALNGLMTKIKDLQLVKGVFMGRGDNSLEISHFFLQMTL